MSFEELAQKRRMAAFALVGTVKTLVFVAKTTQVPIDPKSLEIALASFDEADAEMTAFLKAAKGAA